MGDLQTILLFAELLADRLVDGRDAPIADRTRLRRERL
jgi:hypothetical protein